MGVGTNYKRISVGNCHRFVAGAMFGCSVGVAALAVLQISRDKPSSNGLELLNTSTCEPFDFDKLAAHLKEFDK